MDRHDWGAMQRRRGSDQEVTIVGGCISVWIWHMILDPHADFPSAAWINLNCFVTIDASAAQSKQGGRQDKQRSEKMGDEGEKNKHTITLGTGWLATCASLVDRYTNTEDYFLFPPISDVPLCPSVHPCV